jgi:hypothetical protein
MKKQIKIGITGIAGAGKDFLVDHLTKDLDYTRVSFSDQLKILAKLIYPWMEQDYPATVKETPLNITLPNGEFISKTPREIWLNLNKLREVEDGIFVRMLVEELSGLKNRDIVVSDIRPQLEWDFCLDRKFTTIYIEPAKIIYEPNDFDKQVLTYKDQADYVFVNNFDGLDEWKEFIKEITNV